jgi:hypothetical protein
MTRARDTARIRIETTNTRLAEHADGLLVKNEDIFESDLTVEVDSRVVVAGPVTIPNVTVNGGLNVMGKFNVTGDLEIATAGILNIIG